MQLCFGGTNPGGTSPLWLSDFWPLCELHVQAAAPPLEVRVGTFQKNFLRRPSVFSTVKNLRLASNDNRINQAIANSRGADIIQKANEFARLFCNVRGSEPSEGGSGSGEMRPEWLQTFAGFDGFLLSSAVEVHPCDYLDNGKPCGITDIDMPNVLASVVVIHSPYSFFFFLVINELEVTAASLSLSTLLPSCMACSSSAIGKPIFGSTVGPRTSYCPHMCTTVAMPSAARGRTVATQRELRRPRLSPEHAQPPHRLPTSLCSVPPPARAHMYMQV